MCLGSSQPDNGADSAQSLADAIALIESRGLSVGSVAPACIACSERAEPTSVWCRYHRLRIEEDDAL
jgi:hypothetical protein